MKNKNVAILLALLFGVFGLHNFYLDRKKDGILSIVFFWTGIPSIVSFFNAISLMSMSQSEFDKEYNDGLCSDVCTILQNRQNDGKPQIKIEKGNKVKTANVDDMPDF